MRGSPRAAVCMLPADSPHSSAARLMAPLPFKGNILTLNIKTMKKLLFTLVAALMCMMQAHAQDFTQVVMDENGRAEVELHKGQNYLQHTAIRSGELRINVGFYGTVIYQCERDGVAFDTPLPLDRTATGNEYKITVEEGRTYYFTTSSVVETQTITFYYSDGDNSIQMSSNYEDGAVVSTTDRNLELTFDRAVTCDSYVTCGSNPREELPSSYINTILNGQYFYSVTLSQLINYLIDGGKLAVGDSFTITLENIADAANPDVIYGEDGTFSITFELGEMPATLESINPANGSNIYTYYPVDGEEGLITFTFSDSISTDTQGVDVTVSYGDMEAGSYVAFNPPYTIEGNDVTVDIRGIRFPETVSGGRGGSTEEPTMVSFLLSGLTTTDGRPVSTNYPDVGTSAVLAFYTVVKQEISFIYDFLPQSGTDEPLDNYDEILIWLNNPIMYDGITQTWYNARGQQMSRSFTAEQVPFEWDDLYEGYVAHVSVSDISYNNSPVTLTVDNAYLMNGDAVTITGTFNNGQATGITSVTADGADGEVEVYTIGGTLVRKSAASQALNGLSKGLYIVNGKKYVVR